MLQPKQSTESLCQNAQVSIAVDSALGCLVRFALQVPDVHSSIIYSSQVPEITKNFLFLQQ